MRAPRRPPRAPRLVLAALLFAQPVAAQPPPAESRVHVDRALAAYGAKRYDEAAREFRAAYELEPRSDYLYGWAQSQRLAGNCAEAIPLYERFLAQGSSGANVEVAKINLARCRTTLEPPPRAEVVASPPPPSPWYLDVPGAFLVGAGVTALGAAGGFAIAADRADEDKRRAASYDVFDSRATAVRRWDRLATGALIAGSTLIVIGAVRYLLRAQR